MSEADRELFRSAFMSPELAAKYAYRSARRPGTRLERALRIFRERGGRVPPNEWDLR